MVRSTLALIGVALAAAPASAQSLGTFRWQLQPYCNVVTVNVTGVAGVYTLEGFDDQCGAGTRAPLTGVATPNPDGTIGFGMNLVTSPGGRGVQVEARIALASLGGPWTDSDGNTGTFAFNQKTGGGPRPAPVAVPVIPPAFGLQPDGGFLATGTPGTGAIPASGAGTRMMWHSSKSAFRAGRVNGAQWDDTQIGFGSVAFGLDTTASGSSSAAFGLASTASGAYSFAAGAGARATEASSISLGQGTSATSGAAVALGERATASAFSSIAAGTGAEASGPDAVALGRNSKARAARSVAAGGSTADGIDSLALGGAVASKDRAVAVGYATIADAPDSLALGSHVQVLPGGDGSIVIGDGVNGGFVTQVFQPNQFVVRARGGTTIYSNGATSTGVRLAPNASAWSSLSDASSKENFRDLDAGDLLGRLARMSIREWNYKAQDAAIRHVGPTAQDFHAAFGLGEDPLRISTIDADGIALAGVSALARENAALKAELAALAARLDQLEALKR